MCDHGLKATFLYYENGGNPVTLLRFMSGINWSKKSNMETKELVLKWFKVRDAGLVSSINLTQKLPHLFRIEGQHWWFEVYFVDVGGEDGSKPRTYAAFTGDLGKLSSLM